MSSMAPPLQTPRRPGPSATTPFKTPLRTPGEQTSQTPVVDFDLIEYQKENVQPMSKGRSAHSLSQTLGLKHKQRAEELAAKRQEFESKVTQDKLAESDDPLADWCDYVQWIIVSYPSGASADSGLIPVLERATRSLRHDKRYCNPYESRYLKLWTLYSENVESPELVLNWLLANDVGTACAELYEKAAAVAETRGLYESADSLFKLGIRRNAQPNARLRKRYEEFQERLVRNQSAADKGLDYASALARAMRESRRTMLGNKDEKTGKSVHANVMRGANKSAGLGSSTTVNNGRKLNVFRDTDGSMSGGADGKGPEASDLCSRDVRRQENAKEAKGWNGERLPQKARLGGGGSSALTPGKKTLKVFQDSDEEEAGDERSPSKGRQVSLTKPMLGSSHPEVDLLKKDPFSRWSSEDRAQVATLKGLQLGDVETPNQPAAPSQSKRAPEPSRSSSSKSKSSSSSSAKASSSRPASAAPGVKRPERLALPEALFYPDLDVEKPNRNGGSSERCVEQIIATRLGWQLNLDGDEEEDPWAYLEQEEEPQEVVAEAEEEGQQHEEEQDDVASSTPTRPPPQQEREASSTPTQTTHSARAASPPREPTRTGMRPSSPTVMTKAAEAEVRALFNGDDDDSDDEDEDSVETSSDEEEDEEQEEEKAPARPSQPAPVVSRNDENAGVQATPLRPTSQPLGLKSRAPLQAATPMRKPLGAVAATPLGGLGKKPIYVEEDEDEEEEERPRPVAQRIVHEEEDEESEPEEEHRQYNFGEGEDLLEGGARFDQLTTISERTEFETRWGMNTPGRSRSVAMPTNAEEDEEEEEEEEEAPPRQAQTSARQASQERSFASESSEQRDASAGHTSRFGGKAKFEMSPGYTIEKREDWTREAEASPSMSRKALTSSAPSSAAAIANPCSPTDADVLATILSSLPLAVETSPDFFDLSSVPSGKLATLQRQAKAHSRKSIGNSSSVGMGGGAKDWWLDIDGNPFSIREKLGEGAYGSVFLAEDVNNCAPPRHKKALGGLLGDSSFDLDAQQEDDEEEEEDEDEAERKRMVAIKVEAPANRWEFYVLGQMRARLEARDLESIIGARRFYAFQDESFLLLEWGEKGNLLEIVNQASSAGVAPAGSTSGVEEVLAMFFTIELLRLIEGLHSAQLLHGDLKIDNCLLRLDDAPEGTTWSNSYRRDGSNGWTAKGLYLVDFGRAIDLSVFPEGQRFVADWQTDERDCIEMREGRSWTYEVDYHGVASIAFCLLFGRYIETSVGEDGRQKIKATLKRYWQGELWSRLFDVLLNSGSAQGEGDARQKIRADLDAVKSDMEGWLEENCMKGGKNLKGLLKKLEIWTMSRRG